MHPMDKELICVEGNHPWTFDIKEQEFFKKMKFQDPKRCKEHRKHRHEQTKKPFEVNLNERRRE